MGKRLGISFIVLIVTSCALLSVGLIAGAFFILRAQRNYVVPTVTQAPTPASIEEQMNQIQAEVLQIRGLPLKTDLQRDLMSPEALKDKVINDFFADYTAEDALNDSRVLATLGLLEPGFDLHQFYIDLYSEQVAGYYDSKTKEMYVISGGTFGGMERLTYAHEFTHVLQDQNYDIENGLRINDDYCEIDTEYCAAVTALLEGDATLSEQYWFIQNGTQKDQADLQAFQQSYTSPVYDSAPDYMKVDFLFPYSQGFDFVQSLYGKNKWQSVDNAFKNPPVTTEQILHPEKYPGDVPVKVDMPDFVPALGGDWTEIDRNVMGEWYTYLMLAKGRSTQFQLDDTEARTASAGWGGDTYVYEYSPATDEHLFVWRSTWDAAKDAEEFYTTSMDYGKARWGIPTSSTSTSITWQSDADGVITMRRSGNDVLWIIGSTTSILDTALGQLPDFGK